MHSSAVPGAEVQPPQMDCFQQRMQAALRQQLKLAGSWAAVSLQSWQGVERWVVLERRPLMGMAVADLLGAMLAMQGQLKMVADWQVQPDLVAILQMSMAWVAVGYRKQAPQRYPVWQVPPAFWMRQPLMAEGTERAPCAPGLQQGMGCVLLRLRLLDSMHLRSGPPAKWMTCQQELQKSWTHGSGLVAGEGL